MEHREHNQPQEQAEQLLHCRNCDGYYDPDLPNCPHCGEDTANNVNDTRRSSSVTQYEGGFGEAGSTLSRVAALMVAALLVIGVLGCVVGGVKLFSARNAGGDTSAVGELPPEQLPAAAQPQAGDQSQTAPAQIPPEALRLDYSDLTLVNEGESYQFQVSVEPADWEGELTWTTENQNVADITPEGKVRSVGRGECGIVLSAGEVSYRCLVRCKSGAQADEGGSASVKGYYINGKLYSMDEAQKVIEEERQKAEEARKKAEEEAKKKAEEEAKKKAEEEARKQAEEEAKKQAEEEAKRKAEEEAQKAAEEEAKRKAEEKARKKAEKEAKQAEEEAQKAEEEAKKQAEEEAKKQAEKEAKQAEEEEARRKAEEKAAEEEKKKKSNGNSITLQYYDITLVHVGEGFQFKPSGGDGKSYSWKSANDSVASVSADGYVKATGVGQTTVTCTSGDASVDVVVRVRSN